MERRHRLGFVDLRDDGPAHRVQIDWTVGLKYRNATVVGDAFQACLAPKGRNCDFVVPGNSEDCRAELFYFVDSAARQGRLPQRLE